MAMRPVPWPAAIYSCVTAQLSSLQPDHISLGRLNGPRLEDRTNIRRLGKPSSISGSRDRYSRYLLSLQHGGCCCRLIFNCGISSFNNSATAIRNPGSDWSIRGHPEQLVPPNPEPPFSLQLKSSTLLTTTAVNANNSAEQDSGFKRAEQMRSRGITSPSLSFSYSAVSPPPRQAPFRRPSSTCQSCRIASHLLLA